jgi:hypothetical protein
MKSRTWMWIIAASLFSAGLAIPAQARIVYTLSTPIFQQTVITRSISTMMESPILLFRYHRQVLFAVTASFPNTTSLMSNQAQQGAS